MSSLDWQQARRSLGHVLWIGGAPCAGKTTMSQRLSSDYGMSRYDGDCRFERHFEEADPDDSPVTCAARARVHREGSSVWMFEQGAEEMAAFMRDLGREDLQATCRDLLELPSGEPIVVDLYSGHPSWVCQVARPDRAVFLVATDDFQDATWLGRDGPFRREIEQCVDPTAAMAEFLKCCRQLSRWVRQECRELGLPLLITGGRMDADETYAAICQQFGLRSE